MRTDQGSCGFQSETHCMFDSTGRKESCKTALEGSWAGGLGLQKDQNRDKLPPWLCMQHLTLAT